MAHKPTLAGAQVVGVIRLGRSALLRETALTGAFMVALTLPVNPSVAQPATNARPLGGSVVAGSASIATSFRTTTINQASQNAAINWSSFNIGSSQSVQFNQPATTSITLNRVNSANPSQIAGHITANGTIVLTNPSGVVFAQGAEVNAASVLVTTAGISNQNLIAGKLIFDKPGKPNAMVVNKGTITVAQAGLAALVAPAVANSGVINARMGHVVLAGAAADTIDLYGDGLVSIDVTKQVIHAPVAANGRPVTALVTNTGVIRASGGTVQLTASAVDGIVTNLVDAGGLIGANTARGGKTGTIIVSGIGGSVTIEGGVSAIGRGAGTTGGSIAVDASSAVTLTPTARINASGRAGGGTVAIGTTIARAVGGASVTPTLTAKTTTIAAGAKVLANATRKGQGGRVTVLSTAQTKMAGSISATGGKSGGDGGFVEVSGQSGFALTGNVNVSAPAGSVGTILLDPTDLTITNGTAGTGGLDNTLANNGTVAYGNSASTNAITNGEIGTLTGNIVLQATNTLSVNSNTPITLSNDASLTFQTQLGNISIGTGSAITATGSGSITMLAGTMGSGASISIGSDLTTGSKGGITLKADAGVDLQGVNLGTGTLDLTTLTSGGISQTGGGAISANTLLSSGGVQGQVSLLGTSNAIGTLGAFSAPNGLALTNAGSLSVGGSVGSNSGTVVLNTGTYGLGVTGTISALAATLSAGSIDIGGTLNVTGIASLVANTGSINETAAAVLNAGTLTGSTATTASFNGTNAVTALGSFTADKLMLNAGTAGLAVTGPVTIGTSVSITDTGSLLVSGTIAPPYGTTAIAVGLTGGTLLSITGLLSDGGSGTMSLSTASGGTISAGGGTLIAGTLSGSAGVAQLNGSANAIATLGSFTAGTLVLNAGTAGLAVTGPVTIGTSVSIVDTGSLLISGTIAPPSGTTAIAVGLTGGTLLSITGLLSDGGPGTMSLSAASGGTISAGGGTLIAGTLSGSAGVAQLNGSANAIATLGSFAATGSFALVDSADVTVTAAVGGGTVVAIAAPAVTLGDATDAPGALVASPRGRISVQTGTLVVGTAGGTLAASGGTIEIAPAGTTDILALGTVSSTGTLGFTPADFSITGTTLRLGANNGTTASGGIIIVGSLASVFNVPTLDLRTTGSVTQSMSIIANTLTGVADSVTLTMAGNILATLNGFAAPHGFALTNAGSLSVGGLVGSNSGTIVLNTGTYGLGVPGTISALAATLSAGSIDIGGTLNVTGIASLMANTGSINETATAVLNAATLTGSAATTASFDGTNGFGVLGSLSASSLTLLDGEALSIAGPVRSTGGSVIVNDGSFALSLPGTLVASVATLSAASITIGGTLEITNTAFLVANTGSISEIGALSAGTLTGSAGSGASFNGSNTVVTLGAFAAANGAFLLANSAPMTVEGAISGTDVGLIAPSVTLGNGVSGGSLIATSGGTVSVRADSLGAGADGGTYSAANGVVEIAPYTPLDVLALGGANSSGTLVFDAGDFSITAKTLRLGAFNGVTTAGGISIVESGDLVSVGTLDLESTGGVTQSGSLTVGTLTGNVASATLSALGNSIGTLGSFAAPNGLTVTDGQNLSIVGPVSSTGGIVTVNDGTFALTLPGSIAASAASLSAGLITIGGTLDITNTASLIASTGSISETGALLADTLTGSAGTTARFTGTNSIGTLGSFTAPSGLTVTDGRNLSIAGPVSSTVGVVTVDDATFALSLPGSIAASAASLSAGSITIGGTLDLTNTASLTASSGSISETGALLADTLTGSAGITASFTGINSIGTVGAFTAPSGLTVTDGQNLSLAGPVSSTGGSVTVNDGTFALGLPGALTAPAATLSGGSITIGGTLDLTNTASLIASTGSISETGALLAATLTGSAGTTAGFTGINSIGTLGSFTAPSGLTVTDGRNLSIAGPVSSSAGIVTVDDGTFALSLPGALTAPAATLSGGSITIGGTLDLTNTASLTASSGSISETGALLADTLTGSAGITASFTGINSIGTLGSFTAPSGLTVTDGRNLSIAGPVSSTGGVVTVDDGTFALSLPGSIAASAASLSASSIIIGGTLDITNTASLIASTGSISETGALLAATLTGSAGTTASFTGTNVIATVGSFAAPSGLTVTDGQNLSLAGPVSSTGGSVTVNDGTFALGLPGALTAPAATLSGGSITIGGTLDLTNTASLIASTGSISETGALLADTLTGSAGTTARFTGTNSIGTLGSFTAPSGLTVTDGRNLSIAGPVSSTVGVVTVDDATFALSLPGSIAASAASLSAGSITIGGTLDLTNTASLTASSGSISETGALLADTLTGSAGITASFTGINSIGTVGAFTAPSGLTVTDGQNLSLAGPVSSTGGSVTVNDGTFALGLPGALTAPAATLSGGSITIGGTLDITNTASLIASTGSISETGALLAATLTGSAGTTAGFTGINSIGTLGSFTAPSGLTVTDGRNLSIAGPVSSSAGIVTVDDGTFALSLPGALTAPAATLSGGSITIGGTLDLTNTASLTASSGSISETGALLADTLTGSAGITASFTGINSIGTLGSFTAPSGLTVTDGRNLSIAGPVSSTGGVVTVDDGTFALSLPGSIAASAASLSAGSITIGGTLDLTNTASLTASSGSISETGALLAATLSGSAGTTANFTGINSIGTVGAFTAPSGLTMMDGQNLSLAGPVSSTGGSVTVNDGTFALGLPGALTAPAATLSGGSITIGGTLDITNTASLIASTGSISETGALLAATLTGSAGTTARFTGINSIGTLGSFTAPSGLTVTDGRNLSIAGPVSSTGGVVTVDDGTFALSLPGSIAASAASLSAGLITMGGTLDLTNTASLIASSGSISETGALLAATLSGSAGTTANFTGINSIGTLGSFTAPSGLTMMDGQNLSLAGPVSSTGGSVTVNDGTFALGLPGALTAPAATLSGGSITIGGTLDITNTASLIASTGSISETGALLAATLTGSAGTTAGFTGINSIGTLGSFTAPSGLTVTDGRNLSIAGPVSSSAGIVTVDDGTFALSLPGALTAPAATLSGGSITIGGTLDLTNTASLTASSGSISETGALLADTLTGSAGITASFTGINSIGTLGSFTAPSGLTVTDGRNLSIAGPVSSTGGVVTVDDGTFALSLPGSIAASAASLSASSIIIGGTLDITNTASLIASTGSISETGALLAATLTGSAGTTASFTGTNVIATVGSFAAPSGLTVTDGQNLAVAGLVSAGSSGSVIIDDRASTLSVLGTIVASAATLTAATMAIGGTLDATNMASLTATSGSIEETGAVASALLTGSAATTASLTGGNAIATLGAFTAPSGLTLMDGRSLSISGPVLSSIGSVIVSDGSFTLSIPGTIFASAAAFSAASIAIGGTLSMSGTASLNASTGSISETGALSAGTLTGSAGTAANLIGTNSIGTIAAFNAPAGLTLIDGTNLEISGLVTTAGGPVVVNDGSFAFSLPGAIVANAATLSAGSIGVAGVLDVANTASLIAGGTVSETGALTTGTLTGRAITSASFTGSNNVGVLGNFTVGAGPLILTDATGLTINSEIVANGVTITTPASLAVDGNVTVAVQSGTLALSAGAITIGKVPVALQADTMDIMSATGISIGSGTVIDTGGDVFRRPAADTPPVEPALDAPGAHFLTGTAGFQQTGLLTVNPYVAQNAVGALTTLQPNLDIRLTTGAGTIAFDQTKGLYAPATTLLLTIGSGNVTGQINADDLALFYTATTGHATTLSGTLRTATGIPVTDQAAASQSFVAQNNTYVPSNHFQVNGCAISSINCTVISPFSAVPVINPFNDLFIGYFGDDMDDPDLLLPNVSDRDY